MRHIWMTSAICLLVGAAVPVAGATSPALNKTSTSTDLGTLGGSYSVATAVNDQGEVIGYSATAAGDEHAFLWTHADGMIDLGTPVGKQSRAIALNKKGQVVGTTDYRAFLWTRAGGMVELPGVDFTSYAAAVNDKGEVAGGVHRNAVLWTRAGGVVDVGPASFGSFASDVNAKGEVVGYFYSLTSGAPTHAFLWTQAGGNVDLGLGYATAINDEGQVVGYDGGTPAHAFLWTHRDGIIDLDPGAPRPGGQASYAYAVIANGHIVGDKVDPGGVRHAFLWTPADGIIDLGTLGGEVSYVVSATEARAVDSSPVNDRDQIVGTSTTDTGVSHAFLWTRANGMIDLGTLGGSNSGALAVNASGQIVGQAENASGDMHAVLWEP